MGLVVESLKCYIAIREIPEIEFSMTYWVGSRVESTDSSELKEIEVEEMVGDSIELGMEPSLLEVVSSVFCSGPQTWL